MSKSRILLTYHDLTVEVESTPGEELMEHMHGTTLGQPGSFRYQHTNLEDRLMSPGENYYMYLRKSGKMMGSVGFCGKPAETNGMAHDSWLIRYFSIKAPMRSVPKKRKEKSDLKDENKRNMVLGRFIQPIFAEPSQLREGKRKADPPSIIYAMIEQKNLRSMNFSVQMGLETVGEMASFSFSRLSPKKSARVEQLPEDEQAEMLSLLKEYYREYTLFFTDPIFKNNDYYVIRDKGRVVAGIQIYPVTWRIMDFGSKAANRIIKILVKIPWVRKRITPEKLDLLAFDGIYCEPGYEQTLYELMEGVLARSGRYLAMVMTDTNSALYSIFEKQQKLGIVHKVVGTFMADIRVRFINMPEDTRQYFLDHPTYIPTYDNS
ncbi:MAG: hypothetical protein ABFS28_07730 [Bacteroidota bacterium]